MPTSQAHVPTRRATRYLAQLCKHAGHLGQFAHPRQGGHGDSAPAPAPQHSEWSGTEGVIDFGWGRCTVHVTSDGLTLHAEAEDRQHLQRVQDGIAARLEQIGRRDRLAVNWQQTPPTPTPDDTVGAQ